jgi:hypothetical protein
MSRISQTPPDQRIENPRPLAPRRHRHRHNSPGNGARRRLNFGNSPIRRRPPPTPGTVSRRRASLAAEETPGQESRRIQSPPRIERRRSRSPRGSPRVGSDIFRRRIDFGDNNDEARLDTARGPQDSSNGPSTPPQRRDPRRRDRSEPSPAALPDDEIRTIVDSLADRITVSF